LSYKIYQEDVQIENVVFRSSELDDRLRNGEKMDLLELMEKALPFSDEQTKPEILEIKQKISDYEPAEEVNEY
jgi:hypothetical protein